MSKTLKYIENAWPPREPDWDLYEKCKKLVPEVMPSKDKLPLKVGEIKGFKVIIVDGNKVILDHDFDFVSSGNHEEDPYLCAKDELYWDDNVQLHQYAFDLYHEIREDEEIANGLDYDDAHHLVCCEERVIRTMDHGSDAEKADIQRRLDIEKGYNVASLLETFKL